MNETRLPLRISKDRLRLYGGSLVILGFLPFVLFPNTNGNRWRWSLLWDGNWTYFVGAGATAGTRDLIGQRHVAWEATHGFTIAQPWIYPPGVAWIFVPFAHVSLALGFWINAAVMIAACIAAGVVAARAYALPVAFSILAVLAWLPATASAYDGEDASIALLLSMICVFGLVSNRQILAGAAVGLLLYKPSDAVLFVLLLLLRREWRALVVMAACGAGWYFASVWATARDWAWPYHYATSLYAYIPRQEFANGMIGVSSLLTRLGSPATLAIAVSFVLALAWCIVAAREGSLEVASLTGLITVAASLHANPYEAALLVPAIFYVMTNASEPWRTRIVIAVYAVGGSSILLWVIGFDPVAAVVAVGTVSYLGFRLVRPSDRGPTGQDSPSHIPGQLA